MRINGIDLLKGVLIIFVMLGHILQGEIEESIWRNIIYSIHMPLFVGISGFLFNIEKQIKNNLIALTRNYLFRLIIPWFAAVIIYFLILHVLNNKSEIIIEFIKAFIYPYYHLWFIPGFLSWVILTWIFKRMKISDKFLLYIALLISIVSKILQEHPELYQNLGILKYGIDVVLNTFKLHFFYFFILGLVYSRIEIKKPKRIDALIPLIGLSIVIYLFYNPITLLQNINFFIFNSLLLILSLKLVVQKSTMRSKTIEWIGQNSLGIYLWHVLPILICKFAIGTENLTLFYLAIIGLEIAFIIVYKHLIKINLFKKFAFGL